MKFWTLVAVEVEMDHSSGTRVAAITVPAIHDCDDSARDLGCWLSKERATERLMGALYDSSYNSDYPLRGN